MELPYTQPVSTSTWAPDAFAERTTLVVGGGRGIGRATTVAFAVAGARVAIIARTRSEGEATVAAVREIGGHASFHPADVRNGAELGNAIDAAVDALGGLDIAVNNAGHFASGHVHELDEAIWDDVLEINLKGMWLAMKHELRHMRPRRQGIIVNTASNLRAHATRPGIAAYAAAKAGVRALTRTAALESIGLDIRINAVSPGPIATTMSRRPAENDADRDARVAATLPIGRVGKPGEVADAILWLASPASSFAVGHDLVLDGGVMAS